MANLVNWAQPSMTTLQRDIEDVVRDFSMPRAFFREVDRLFEDMTTPRSLWRDMERLLEDFDTPPALGTRLARIFESSVGTPRRVLATTSRGGYVPALDLIERDGDYLMRADLPGIREQDIDVRIDDDNVLSVSGERTVEPTTLRGRGYEYSERATGSFCRSIALPSGIDASKVHADFSNGVLEIVVPKTEAARSRRIPLSREEPRVMGAGNGPTAAQKSAQAQRS